MRLPLRSVLVTVASLALFSLPVSHAAASAFCSFEVPVTLSPGLSAMTPTSGTFTTGGQTGKLMCHGDAYGKAITGPGTIGYDGKLDSQTCSSGTGTGTAKLVLPTTEGPMEFSYDFTFQRAALLGSFMSDYYSGGFGFMPTKGDCFTAPVTAAMVEGGAKLG
jgi:hypothetical protein